MDYELLFVSDHLFLESILESLYMEHQLIYSCMIEQVHPVHHQVRVSSVYPLDIQVDLQMCFKIMNR